MMHSVTICARKSLYCLNDIDKSWIQYTNLPNYRVLKVHKSNVFEKCPDLRVIYYVRSNNAASVFWGLTALANYDDRFIYLMGMG